jgi:hypothetical protein
LGFSLLVMPAMLMAPHLGCQVKTQPDTFSFLLFLCRLAI